MMKGERDVEAEEESSQQIQVHDIIIAFEHAGGFGDVLFALKVAELVREGLKHAKKLTGDVYLVTDDLGHRDIIAIKGDMEFGVSFIKKTAFQKYLDSSSSVVSYIIEGPVFLYLYDVVKPLHVPVLLMPEYSLPASIEKFYQGEYSIIKQYGRVGESSPVTYKRTGFPVREQTDYKPEGILLSSQLIERRREKSFQAWFALRYEYRRVLLRDMTSDGFYTPDQYHTKKELSFAYKKHTTGVVRFLKACESYLSCHISNKYQDILIVCKEKGCYKSILKEVRQMVPELLRQGYLTIECINLNKVVSENLSKNPGNILRVLYVTSLDHEEMIAMCMLSGEFAGTTGDQSFGEAISADCIIEYEISGDKVPLIEGYRDLAEPGSVREALHELGCSGGKLDAQKLGQLLSNPTVIEGIHAVNRKVHTNLI